MLHECQGEKDASLQQSPNKWLFVVVHFLPTTVIIIVDSSGKILHRFVRFTLRYLATATNPLLCYPMIRRPTQECQACVALSV